MRRVLHVIGRMDRGGTESMLMSYYRHIDREKCQFDFVVHTKETCAFEDEITSLGGRILRVPRFNMLNLWQYRKAWRRLFAKYTEYDIIHIHHFLVAGIILPIAAKYGITVRIVHSHNTKPPIFLMKEKAMWLFHRDMMRYSTLCLACGNDAGKYLFGNNDFMVIRNAIETEKFRYSVSVRNKKREEIGLNSEDFVVGHIGSFRTKQKNHNFIIDIFAEIVKYVSNAKLLLVGIGDLQDEIKNKVHSLGLDDKCIFVGSRNDVPLLLSAMDVFLFPSLFEGLSVVLIEAQTSGLPCVVSSVLSSETKLIETFTQIDLSDSVQIWAKAVISSRVNKSRELYCDDVRLGGYDIRDNVKILEEIYQL